MGSSNNWEDPDWEDAQRGLLPASVEDRASTSLRSPQFQQSKPEDLAGESADAVRQVGALPEVERPTIQHRRASAVDVEEQIQQRDQAEAARQQASAEREREAIERSGPYAGEDGSWKVQRADAAGNVFELPAERVAKVDRGTGEKYFDDGLGNRLVVGRDEAVAQRAELGAKRKQLALEQRMENAGLDDLRAQLGPAKEALKAYGERPEQLAKQVERMRRAINPTAPDSGAAKVLANAEKQLADWHAANPDYLAQKQQLDTLTNDLSTREERKRAREWAILSTMADPEQAARFAVRPRMAGVDAPAIDAQGDVDAGQVEAFVSGRKDTRPASAVTLETLTALRAQGARSVGGKPIEQQIEALTAAPKPKVVKPFFTLDDTISGIWDAVSGLGVTGKAAFYQLTQGLIRPDQYSAAAKAAFKEADQRRESMQAKTAEKLARGESTSVGESLREAGDSLGFSVGTMAAALPAGIAGAKAGAAVGAAVGAPVAGAGAAPGAATGALIGGAAGTMLASGAAAYRMAGATFLNESFSMLEAESQKKNGRPLNEQEKAAAFKALLPIAKNTALWEAGPEAVANAVTLGAGKMAFGLGKPLMEKFAKTALGKLTAVTAAVGTELATETLTQVEQSADSRKAQALAEGKDPTTEKANWSAGGVMQAFKEVAPQTLALLGLMGGAGGVAKGTMKIAERWGRAEADGNALATTASQLEDKRAAARTARENGDLAAATTLDEEVQGLQSDLHRGTVAMIRTVPEARRKAAALGVDPEADFAGNEVRLESEPVLHFASAEIGRTLRGGEPGADGIEQFVADQHAGLRAVRDLVALAQNKPIDAARAVQLEQLGLVEAEDDVPGMAPRYRVTDDAVPLLPAGMRAAVGKQAPLNVTVTPGETGDFLNNLVRGGQRRVQALVRPAGASSAAALTTSLTTSNAETTSKAGARAPTRGGGAAPSGSPAGAGNATPTSGGKAEGKATYRVRVNYTTVSGEPAETVVKIGGEKATAVDRARQAVEKTGRKVSAVEVIDEPPPEAPAVDTGEVGAENAKLAEALKARGVKVSVDSLGGPTRADYEADARRGFKDGDIRVHLNPRDFASAGHAALAAQEELAHAADLLALKRQWEAGGRAGSFADFVAKDSRAIANELLTEWALLPEGKERAEIEKAIVAARNLYFQKRYSDETPSVQTVPELVAWLKSGGMDVGYVRELLRQLVQLRKQGVMVEEVLPDFLRSAVRWLRRALAELKALAATLDAGALKNSKLALAVRAIEAELQSLSQDERTTERPNETNTGVDEKPTGTAGPAESGDRGGAAEAAAAPVAAPPATAERGAGAAGAKVGLAQTPGELTAALRRGLFGAGATLDTPARRLERLADYLEPEDRKLAGDMTVADAIENGLLAVSPTGMLSVANAEKSAGPVVEGEGASYQSEGEQRQPAVDQPEASAVEVQLADRGTAGAEAAAGTGAVAGAVEPGSVLPAAGAEADRGSGSGDAGVGGKKKGNFRFRIPPAPEGGEDLLDALIEFGRIRSPGSYAKGERPQEYDGHDQLPLGIWRRIVFKKGGTITPDIAAQHLFEAGWLSDPSPDALWAGLISTIQTRRNVQADMKAQEVQWKQDERFQRDALDPEANAGEPAFAADELAVGDTVTVDGTEFAVTAVDPDGEVTLEDGKRYGVQTVEAGQIIYGEVEPGEPAPEKNAIYTRPAVHEEVARRLGMPVPADLDARLSGMTKAEAGAALRRYGKTVEELGGQVLHASNATVRGPQIFTLYTRTAYHGTPHEVDRFSLSKIGTGEGAQVYGWGLYFAENPKVADGYRKNLQAKEVEAVENLAAALATMERSLATAPNKETRDRWEAKAQELRGKLAAARIAANKSGAKAGNTYTVTLDVEPEELLDWDKPLSEQSEKVKAAFRSLWEELGEKNDPVGPQANTGGSLYIRLTGKADGVPVMSAELLSDRLAGFGIPGIRYLDQGSRIAAPVQNASGQWEVMDANGRLIAKQPTLDLAEAARRRAQTYNYVIFDESKIRITHRNGEAVTMGEATGALFTRPAEREDELGALWDIAQAGPGTEAEAQSKLDAKQAEIEKVLIEISALENYAKRISAEEPGLALAADARIATARRKVKQLRKEIKLAEDDVQFAEVQGGRPLSAAEAAKWGRVYRRLWDLQQEGKTLNEGQRKLFAQAERALGQGVLFGDETKGTKGMEGFKARWEKGGLKGTTDFGGDFFDERPGTVGRFTPGENQGALFSRPANRGQWGLDFGVNGLELFDRAAEGQRKGEGRKAEGERGDTAAEGESEASDRPAPADAADELPLGDLSAPAPVPVKAEAPRASAGVVYDFGEKIGGARKDLAEKTGSREAKEKDVRPAWARKYHVFEDAAKPGEWVIGTSDGGLATRQHFASREEAERAVPLLEVARNHEVRGERIAPPTADEQAAAKQVATAIEANAKQINELREKNQQLLMAARLTERYRRAAASGEISPARYDELKAAGQVLSDRDYAAALTIEQQIRTLQDAPAPARPGDSGMVYAIVRKLGDRKRPVVKGGFATREEAMRYMAEHPAEIIEHKFPFPEKPWLDRIERTGPDRRGGKDVSPATFQQDFGFRGGEFGNWNMGSDGQAALNHAFDALHDLADALGVPPRALSLNGELAIAFGARGHGLQGARAHYERNYAVINLTKIMGAGSAAHEWFHALDHYLGRQDTKASSEKTPGGTYKASADPAGDYVSHGFKYNSKVRAELREAFSAVMKAMVSKQVTGEIDQNLAAKNEERMTENVRRTLAEIRRDFASYYKKDRKTGRYETQQATPAQLARFDELAAPIARGEVGERKWTYGTKNTGRASFAGRYSVPEVEALNDYYKEVTGRSFAKNDPNSQGSHLVWELNSLKDARERFKQASVGVQETKARMTEYLRESRKIDSFRASDYWSTPHEMGARAFESFVHDKLAGQSRQSDYLVHGVENRFYRLFGMKPYPEGDERTALNGLWQQLFDTIQTKETERGVALFTRRAEDPVVVREAVDLYLSPHGLETNPQARAEIESLLREDAPGFAPGYAQGELFQGVSRSGGAAGNGTGGGRSADTRRNELIAERRRENQSIANPFGDEARAAGAERGRVSSVIAEAVKSGAPVWDVKGAVILNAGDAFKLLQSIRSPYVESIKAAVLDESGRVVASEVVSLGTLNEGLAHPRELYRVLLKYQAQHRRVLLAHNHPSGDPTPSSADRQMTAKFENVAEELGFTVVDHLVTNGERYFSFRESGFFTLPKQQGFGYREAGQTAPGTQEEPAEFAAMKAARSDLADWETVRRSSLAMMDPQEAGRLVRSLRNADPTAGHVFYLNTKMRLTAMERVEGMGDPARVSAPSLVRWLSEGVAREGAYGVIVHFPMEAGAANPMAAAVRNWSANFGVKLFDIITDGNPTGIPRLHSESTGMALYTRRAQLPDTGTMELPFAESGRDTTRVVESDRPLPLRKEVGEAAPSVAELVKGNVGLAVSIANQFSNIAAPMEDVVSVARVALVKAAKAYDPERGNFPAFAGAAIRNALMNFFKSTQRGQRMETTLDAEPEDGGDGAKNLVTRNAGGEPVAAPMAALEQRETADELAAAIARLPERPRTVLQRLAAGDWEKEIAADLGMTQQAVSKIAGNARKAVAAMLRAKGLRGVDGDGVLYTRKGEAQGDGVPPHPEDQPWYKAHRKDYVHVNLRGDAIDPERDFKGWVLPIGGSWWPNAMSTAYGRAGLTAVLVPKAFVESKGGRPPRIAPGFRPTTEQIATIRAEHIRPDRTVDWAQVFAPAELRTRVGERSGGGAASTLDELGGRAVGAGNPEWFERALTAPEGSDEFEPIDVKAERNRANWWERWPRKLAILFESAADRLQRQKNKAAQVLAKALVDYTDYSAGIEAQLAPKLEAVLEPLGSKERKQAKAEFADFYKTQESMSEAEALAKLKTFSEPGQQLVQEFRTMAAATGAFAQRKGVQVWDQSENEGKGGYRLIGNKGAAYFPRMLSEKWRKVIEDPDRYAKVKEEMNAELRANEWSEAEIANFWKEEQKSFLTRNDFFGQLEMARTVKLPASFYEYAFDKVAPAFIRGYSDRMAQIMAFKQKLKRDPLSKDLFDEALEESQNKETRDYIEAIQKQVYKIAERTTANRWLATARTLASGLLLANPVGTVPRNFISGIIANIEEAGMARTLKALGMIVRGTVSQMTAKQVGTVKANMMDATTYDTDDLDASRAVRAFSNFTLKWSGYHASERFVRTLGTASAMQWLTDYLATKPGSKLALEAEAMLRRMEVDPAAIREEKGDFAKGKASRVAIRRWVKETQFGYATDQATVWANTPTGRFLMTYSRWGTQRSRYLWRHVFEPAMYGEELVGVDGKRYKVRRLKPLAKLMGALAARGVYFGGTAILTGEIFALVAQGLFKRDRDDDDWSVIKEKLKDPEQKGLEAVMTRVLNDVMVGGMLGILSQPLDMAKAWVSGARFKNPIEPPVSVVPRSVIELVRSWTERGMPANIEDMESGHGKDFWTAIRTMAPGAGQTFDTSANLAAKVTETIGWVETEEAKRAVLNLRKAARRFAAENGMEAGGFEGRMKKSPRTAIFDRMQNALLIGDTAEAQSILEEYQRRFANEPDEKANQTARTAFKASMRARQPVRVGASTGEKTQEAFLSWAQKNLDAERFDEFLKVQRTYQNTAELIGLMEPRELDY